MGGKLGNNKLAQFKLGDSHVSGEAAVAVTGMFDQPTPTATHYDAPTPS